MIEAEFSFLVDLGFRSIAETAYMVRYERDDGVFVKVFRDPYDKYVGYRIGLTSRPQDALTATELAELSGLAVPRSEYPERADRTRAMIARAAQELKRRGERPLSGDESIYDEAMELRRAYTQQFTRQGPGKEIGASVAPTHEANYSVEDKAKFSR
jgi:hypothetical protein